MIEEHLTMGDRLANQANQIRLRDARIERLEALVKFYRHANGRHFAAGVALAAAVLGAAWLIGSYQGARWLNDFCNAVGWYASQTGAGS